MSDMSSLSHEYASTTDFSHHVNHAVLLLKKRYLGNAVGLSEKEVSEAVELVSGIVGHLLQRLGVDVGRRDLNREEYVIPEDVLVRVEERQRGNREYFVDDLKRLDESLSSGSDLSPAEIELLDAICEVADASASATFRKLWRR
jgi:hypothetical protein